jgi:hypothetical protein
MLDEVSSRSFVFGVKVMSTLELASPCGASEFVTLTIVDIVDSQDGVVECINREFPFFTQLC